MKKVFVFLVILFMLFGVSPGNSQIIEKENMSHILDNEIDPNLAIDSNFFFGQTFTLNNGQISDPEVVFHTQDAYFTRTGVIFRVLENKNDLGREFYDFTEDEHYDKGMYIYEMIFLGANNVIPVGIERLTHNNNYFFGADPSSWITNAPNYHGIVYENLYDKIDLLFRTTSKGTKYEFLVHPGGEVQDIKLKYEGVELSADSTNIYIHTPLGSVIDGGLYVYQQKYNDQVPIEAEIKLDGDIVHYTVEYDPQYPLVIDPLIYSTLLGGNLDDAGYSITLDSLNKAHIVGKTVSPNFPTSPGVFNEILNDSMDIFVVKLNAAGTDLEYSTFIGGTGDDFAKGVSLDKSGNAYVTGYTESSNFPTTVGAYKKKFRGGLCDVFVLKLNSTGAGLLYSTYVGGTSADYGYSIALDSTNNAYVTGYTLSIDFPTTQGAYNVSYQRWKDVFVFKLNSSGDYLLFSTYIGGSDDEKAYSINLDSSGNAYITGYTKSSDFPVTASAFNEINSGGEDIFVLKLNASGNKLVYSTFIGGVEGDRGYSIAVDTSNNSYITGYTWSNDFPTSTNAVSKINSGGISDVFILKLNPAGSQLVYSTYIGGSDEEVGYSIALDSGNNAIITGFTWSLDFPISEDPIESDYQDWGDAFVLTLNSTGGNIWYSTYIGGSDEDIGYSITLDVNGNAYVVGSTSSIDFPTTLNSYDSKYNNWTDVFILKLEFPKLPHPPKNLTLSEGHRYVSLTWDPPGYDGGSAITNYMIHRGINDAELEIYKTLGNKITAFNDSNVTNGITYYYVVSAKNGVGESDWTPVINVTPGAVPTQPRFLITTLGDSNIFLNWSEPFDDNGFPIIKYTIYKGLDPSEISMFRIIGNFTSYDDKYVENGVTYYYAISAHNIRGEGPISDIITSAPGKPPSAPQNLSVEKINNYFLLKWLPPKDLGGFNVTHYNIYRGIDGSESEKIAETGLLIIIDSYDDDYNNLSYYVTAVTLKGEGSRSEIVTILPSDPTEIQINLTAILGDGFVLLNWELMNNSTDMNIVIYHIYRGKDIHKLSLHDVTTGLFYNDTSVENQTTYYYRISGINSNGEENSSNIVFAKTLGYVPGSNGDPELPLKPVNLTAEAGNGFVRLFWQPPLGSGINYPGIIEYNIYRGENTSDLSFYMKTPGLAYNDSSVINNLTYYYAVSALNIVGEGELSYIIQATPSTIPQPGPGPVPNGTPGAPKDLVVSVYNNTVVLNWTPPDNTGDDPIVGYNIYRGTSRLDMLVIGFTNNLSFIDTTLKDGIHYYKVSGVNRNGEGLFSAVQFIDLNRTEVENDGEEAIGDGGNLWWLIVLLVIIIILFITLFLIIRKKRTADSFTESIPEPPQTVRPPLAWPVKPKLPIKRPPWLAKTPPEYRSSLPIKRPAESSDTAVSQAYRSNLIDERSAKHRPASQPDKPKVKIKRPRKYAVPLKLAKPTKIKEQPRKFITAVQPDRSKSSQDRKP